MLSKNVIWQLIPNWNVSFYSIKLLSCQHLSLRHLTSFMVHQCQLCILWDAPKHQLPHASRGLSHQNWPLHRHLQNLFQSSTCCLCLLTGKFILSHGSNKAMIVYFWLALDMGRVRTCCSVRSKWNGDYHQSFEGSWVWSGALFKYCSRWQLTVTNCRFCKQWRKAFMLFW